MRIFLILTISLGMMLGACQPSGQKSRDKAYRVISTRPPFPYDLEKPTATFSLPHELREASALSYLGRDSLALVQDEKGKIFIFDLDQGQVVKEQKFHKRGDYEGIEVVKGHAYVLQSDGDIFRVADYLGEDFEKTKFENELGIKNDTEGLGYDPRKNQLLIACKGSPNLEEKKHTGYRAVYAFDLNSDSLLPEPVLLVSLDSIKAFLHEGAINQFSRKIIEALDDDVSFRPSAVAIHPITDHIYLLASIGKMLIAMDWQGKFIHIHHLDTHIFKQPEGMCFAPDGTLFIANEAKGGKANILSFSYQQP